VTEPDQDAKNFLERWSQRKQAAAHGHSEGASPDARGTEPEAPADESTASAIPAPAFDPKTLPPIESITATSDIRAFLAPEVPEELKRAALRRAWASDPAIRDFIGLAENQWDFTQPDSVPGFGSLELTPELRRLVAQWLGDVSEEQPPSGQARAQAAETSAELPSPMTSASPADDAANAAGRLELRPVLQACHSTATQAQQTGSGKQGGSGQRKHGSALPR
jgi:hypothetical protein